MTKANKKNEKPKDRKNFIALDSSIAELKQVWSIIQGINLNDVEIVDQKITYAPSVLIWQYIRFNKNYIDEYNNAAKSKTFEWRAFEFKWGLPKLIEPNISCPSKTFHMKVRPIVVSDISDFKKKSETIERVTAFIKINKWRTGETKNGKVLLLQLDDDFKPDELIKEIKKLIPKKKKEKFKLTSIDTNAICFLIDQMKVNNLVTSVEALKLFTEVTGQQITQYHQIRRRVDSFKKISTNAPFSLFQRQA